MKIKKVLLFLFMMLLVCFDIKISSVVSNDITISSYSEFTDPVFKRISSYSNESLHKRILEECDFIHKKNFKNLDRKIFSLMVSECDKYELPYSIFFSVVDRESGFRFIPNSEGSGAMGYMQLMPKTFSTNARKLGLKGGHTPENNIKIGAYILSKMYSEWKSKYNDDKTAWTWALAQYAVGLGGLQVKDSTGIKYHIPESTKPGIQKVMRNYNEDL